MEAKAKTRKLLPPKNLRQVKQRTCVFFCRYGSYDGNGSLDCARPGVPSFDVGDGKYRTATCDRYAEG